MPTESNTVLPACAPVDELRFHAAMMECVTRLVARHGSGKVAQVMALSVRQLGNLGNGSFPRPDRLANLRTLDRGALDPIDRLYGERSVPREGVCSTDPISSRMAALLSRTIEMEQHDSDGGHRATLAEVLALCASAEDEATLRKIVRVCSGWLEMVDAYRAGERPNLRSVQS